jgi:hypothetical protein
MSPPKMPGPNPTAALREPGLAAKPDVLLGFQLLHPQEMAEHLQPMALRQQGQIGDVFRNESRGLVRPAIAARFIGARRPIFAGGCAAPPVAFFLGQKLHPTLCFQEKYTLFRVQLWDAFYNFFDTIP